MYKTRILGAMALSAALASTACSGPETTLVQNLPIANGYDAVLYTTADGKPLKLHLGKCDPKRIEYRNNRAIDCAMKGDQIYAGINWDGVFNQVEISTETANPSKLEELTDIRKIRGIVAEVLKTKYSPK